MTVRHRATIDGLPRYVPGKNPRGGRPQVKLASNELPYPPLPSVQAALADTLGTLNRYPDFHKVELTGAIAAHHGISADRILVDNGSGALLQVLASVFAGPGEEVVYAWRSFDSYPIVTAVAGATAVRVPLDAEHRHDLAAMAAAVTDQTRMIIICNPNNPTGTVVGAAELDRFLDAVPTDVLVVLDEAYCHFVTDPQAPSGLEVAARRPNVAVLRTFSKAYGLAGLRVGYCVADPAIIDWASRAVVGFSVSAPAQAGALASLSPQAAVELRDRIESVVSERTRLTEALIALGVPAVPSQSNFVFMPIPDGPDRAAAFDQGGVILRAYGPDGLRVTVGTPEENDHFLKVARDVWGS